MRYGLTEKQRTRTIWGRKTNSCTRLFMNAYVMMVIKGDGPEKEGDSVMKGDSISLMHWVQQCHGGKTRRGQEG